MRLTLLAVVLSAVMSAATAARILVVIPFPGKSHYIYISSVLKALTDDGHEVVEYSPFGPKKPIANHTHIHITTDFEQQVKNWGYEEFKKMSSGTSSMFGHVFLWFMVKQVVEDTFKHEQIKKLLKSDEHFDLVILESTFAQEGLLVFGHRFKAPVISLQGFGLHSILNHDSGNDLAIASIPDMTSFDEIERMPFFSRVLNLISTSVMIAAYELWHLPACNTMLQKYHPKDLPPLPPIQDMVSNISLYFVNTLPGIAYVQPVTPNIIPIAGITISPDRTPLPLELKKFMDEAKEGVVYFSLGTVVPAHLLPTEMLQIFAKVFGRLKQKVLWKIELDTLPGLPSNVRLEKWVPQPGVLGHPNTHLFMTHGGLFSQQEALYAGVPTVGIPFFGDQPYNIKLSEYRGFGVRLDFNTLSEQSLHNALSTVLDNPRYRETAQRLSRVFRDKPQSPKETVQFWTNYVLKHKGAPHLRPVSASMPWYQLALLDVVGFLLLISSILLAITYFILKRIFSALCGGTQHKQVPSSKKKN